LHLDFSERVAKFAAMVTRTPQSTSLVTNSIHGSSGAWSLALKLEASQRAFVAVVLILVAAAIGRSALATRLDDFHLDEPYHIAAGVSYVRFADFRLNPEHPPVVKLWVGAFISATGFQLKGFRQFHDKADERTFTEENVYLYNDSDSVQRRARITMWTLNALLLIAVAFAVRSVFGGAVALGTVLILAIDPTVAAHLPLVLTDLPVSLIAATAVLLATRAFRSWRWKDVILCSVALGIALGTKHSALVFYGLVGLAGLLLAIVAPPSKCAGSRFRCMVKVAVVLFSAPVILWSLYFFRFTESRETREVFNLPLAEKIADLHSPFYRFALREIAATHVLPRAYVWGLADSIRAGIQSRAASELAFGRPYYGTGPGYFFPGIIALKLPIGVSALIILGVILFVRRRLPRACEMPVAFVLVVATGFLFVLTRGSTYAGIRHALPLVVLLAIIGGIAVRAAAMSSTWSLQRMAMVLALLLAAASALPVVRPYEYFNEIIAGGRNAYLYFGGEGVDFGLRGKELAKYYHDVVLPGGEIPYLAYRISLPSRQARGLDWVGRDLSRDEARLESPVWSGTIFITAEWLGKRLWWDNPTLRAAVPVARFGNLLIFRGTFSVPGLSANVVYRTALRKIYSEKPDLQAAQQLLSRSAAIDLNAFFVNIELGNVCMRRGLREDALHAYAVALEHAPNDAVMRGLIENQIRRVSLEPLNQISILRNPALE
jgi:dolichyl-phosphate-mannose-protein mannosyltransferase